MTTSSPNTIFRLFGLVELLLKGSRRTTCNNGSVSRLRRLFLAVAMAMGIASAATAQTTNYSTTTTLTVTPAVSSVIQGTSVSLKASVRRNIDGRPVSGAVNFFSGIQQIGGASLDPFGEATINVAIPPGNYNIVAQYSGFTNLPLNEVDQVSSSSPPYGLTVIPGVAPTITQQPASLAILAGTTATFTAAATGTPAPTVQWFQSTNNGQLYLSIPGATSNTYSFTPNVSQDKYRYLAIFTNAAGNAQTSGAILNVTRAPQATLTVTTSTSSIPVGNTTRLSTTGGSGSGALTYAITNGTAFCTLASDSFGFVVMGRASGTCTVTATKAADSNTYLAASATTTVTVTQGQQAPLGINSSAGVLGFGGTTNLTPTGGSGTGAVTYAVTAGESVCSVTNNVLRAIGAGTCTVTVTKAADANYFAQTGSADFNVFKAAQAALRATATPAPVAWGSTSTLAATGGSTANPVVFSVTSGNEFCSISGNILTGIKPGGCIVTITRPGDANFLDITTTFPFSVVKQNQPGIVLNLAPSPVLYNSSGTLSTTGGAGTGAVTYTLSAASTVCAVAGDQLTAIGVGSCNVIATKAADANYNATSTSKLLSTARTSQAPLTVSASPSTFAVGTTSTVSMTGGSGTGAVTYAVTAGGASCSLVGTTVTAKAVGTCTVTATKAADNLYNSRSAPVTLTVTQGSQALLTVSAGAVGFNGTTTLSTTGGSGTGAVSYAVTAGASNCSVTGNTLKGLAVGTCTVTATKAADVNFAASQASVDVTVGKGAQAALRATALPGTIAWNGTATLSTTGGSSTGAVSYAVTAGADKCSVSGNTVSGIQIGTCTVTATKAGDANYLDVMTTLAITLGKANQTTFTVTPTPSTIPFGGTSTLTVTGGGGTGALTYAQINGQTACSLADNVVTAIGVGTCDFAVSKAADADYNAISRQVRVTIVRALQGPMTVEAFPAIVPMGTTSVLSINGGSGAGAVTYAVTTNPSICFVAGNVLTPRALGTCTVTATKAADANYAAQTATIVVTVSKAHQQPLVVTSTPPAILYNGTSSISVTGGSGTGALTYQMIVGTEGTFCTINGTTLTGIGVGMCTVGVTKAGDATYEPISGTVNVSVGKALQAPVVIAPGAPKIVFGGSTTLGSSGGTGNGAVTYTVTAGADVCSINNNVVTAIGAGKCTITATKVGDANYEDGVGVFELTVDKAPQVALTAIATPASIAFNGTSSLSTTGGSGSGVVSYAATLGAENCSINGSTLTGTGAGTCRVTATKDADANYMAATAIVDLSVAKAAQAPLAATSTPATIVTGGTSSLGTTGGSGTGVVDYTVTSGANFCSVSGGTLTGLAAGTCTIRATKASDANYDLAATTFNVTVGLAPQASLTATATPASIVYNGTSTIGANGGSGTGAVSYAVTSGASFCSLSGTTLTGIGVGSCAITATKAADAGYMAATGTVVVTVGKADQAALAASATPASIPFNTTSALGFSGGSGTGAVSYAVTAGAGFCSITGTTLRGIAVGSCTVTATKAADAGYAAATSTAHITVINPATTLALTTSATPIKAGQSVTFTAKIVSAPASRVASRLGMRGTSSAVPTTPTGTVTFKNGTATLGNGTIGAGGMATFTTTTLPVGTHSITAEYAGDGTFTASVSNTVSHTSEPNV